MIDAVKFSSAFTAFWNSATPTCEHFIRRLNLSFYDRFDVPMANSKTTDRAFIAEFGFSLFIAERWPSIPGQSRDEIKLSAQKLARARIEPLQGQGDIPESLSIDQINEVYEISKRLSSFFRPGIESIITRPIFPGCGFIDHSEADILSGSSLYEVKTVDRGFRSNDIRQLITYCALNSLRNEYFISNVGLINPRLGTSFQIKIEDLSREISGRSSNDLFEEIYQAISAGGISR